MALKTHRSIGTIGLAALISIGCNIGSVANASQAVTFQVPSKFSCKAKEQFADEKSVAVAVEQTDLPIITIISSDKDLNFKIGRQFVGGEKIDLKSDVKCDNEIVNSKYRYSYEYKCRHFITDIDGSKKETHNRVSRFSVNDSGNGEVCKYLSYRGSRCWELSACK